MPVANISLLLECTDAFVALQNPGVLSIHARARAIVGVKKYSRSKLPAMMLVLITVPLIANPWTRAGRVKLALQLSIDMQIRSMAMSG